MIVRTYLNADLESVDVTPFLNGTAACFSTRAPGKTLPNQDCAALVAYGPDAGVIAVADGLGGIPGGDDASRLAVQTLIATLEEGRALGANLRDVILDGIERSNRRLLELALGNATTLAVAEINGGTMRSYHVGDAVILLTGQRGRLKLQTVPHSPTGYALESGLLDESAAMRDDERHLVSNVIGSAEMRIEIGPEVTLAPRDTLVVSSDGLFDNLFVAEIVELSRKGALAKAGDALSTRARAHMAGADPSRTGHPDDLTFALYRRN